MSRTLLVTNDFPPRPGGIQRSCTTSRCASRPARWWSTPPPGGAPPSSTPSSRSRWSASDTGVLLPTPAVARRAAELARAHGCDTVWFGAAAPLGLLADGLRRRAGIRRAVALTHGHEVGWAALPGARAAAAPDRPRRRRGHLPRRVHPGPAATAALHGRDRAATGWRPAWTSTRTTRRWTAQPVRARHGLADRPVVVCVSRLVPRKGQDMLIRALPAIRRRVPGAALLMVGGGPYRADAGEAGPAGRRRARRGLHRLGAVGRTARALRGRRRLRDAVPHPQPAAWTSRGSASSTWRRPRPGCRWWPATPAARRTRSARARPGTSSRAATSPSSPTGWPPCSPTGTWPASWARRAGPGWRGSGAGRPRPGD